MMKSHCERIRLFRESIFATMTKLSLQHQAINLAQGFPDFDCPDWLKVKVSKAMSDGWNQYAPFAGLEITRIAIARYYERFYGLSYDPQTQVTVTCGATEAIFTTILSLVNPGDEVIVFEPFYDSYLASIQMAGGIPVPVTLRAPDFSFDREELSKAFSAKTKLVIWNNPHNPTGRVFSREEMETLSQLICQYDAYALSDEVYEFLTYDGVKHLPLAKIKGMQERTVTISSMGKTFGATGWKLGWVATSAEINHSIRMVHQFNTFSVATPFQVALAQALDELEIYLPEFRQQYQAKRNLFYESLKEVDFRPIHPQGTYFIMCPIDHLTRKSDVDFCRELIERQGVAAIPPSPFYLHSDEGQRLVRFCFAKKDETLKSALQRLQAR